MRGVGKRLAGKTVTARYSRYSAMNSGEKHDPYKKRTKSLEHKGRIMGKI